MSRSSNQDDFVDVRLVNLGIMEDLLNRLEDTAKEILAKILKMNTSDKSSITSRFNGCLSNGREGTMFARGTESIKGMSISRDACA